jgi:hypothetical protein
MTHAGFGPVDALEPADQYIQSRVLVVSRAHGQKVLWVLGKLQRSRLKICHEQVSQSELFWLALANTSASNFWSELASSVA